MKTTLLALLLLLTSILVAVSADVAPTPSLSKIINQMSKDQITVLQDALDSKSKAEAERVVASASLTIAKTEITELQNDVKKLTEFSEGWQKRSDWFQETNVRLDIEKKEAVEKYSTISHRVHYVGLGCAILVAICVYCFTVTRFTFGFLQMNVHFAAIVVGGGFGLIVFTAIELFFRVK